jgi:hypothetical protein
MIETIVDEKKDLTIHKCSGDLTKQEILDTIHSFYGGDPTLYTLWDLSNASVNSFSSDAVRNIFTLIQRIGSRRQGGKTAVVVPEDLGYGMARMFQIMSDTNDFPFKIKVFRYYGEASQWLLEKK